MIGHVIPTKVYFLIFAALMVLTAVTVRMAFIDLGALNNVIMLSIAVLKATLVILYFMHVRWSDRLVWIAIALSLLWLVILVVAILHDYLTRGWLPVPGK